VLAAVPALSPDLAARLQAARTQAETAREPLDPPALAAERAALLA
jgi:hypothetical protein